MADNEGRKVQLTVKSIKGQPWQKPDSDQLWHSIVAEEKPGEPITFIQDTSKDAPAPEYGKKYTGKVYPNPKGLRFYADGAKYQNASNDAPSASESATAPKPAQTTGWDDRQRTISAQWAIGRGVELAINGLCEVAEIETYASNFLEMTERLKAPVISEEPASQEEGEDYGEIEDKKVDLSEIPF